ncbi:glycoside hydrolase family 5 protein [Nocardioides humilatus]|uniref:Glycoside hydrolase family 5 protein n=1 Tax=Nocardioides humilatus TaxID=2607660 RepID=A0A5B1LDM8_9ACTN|nr:cellulase family glycosylhydrolase [Nocardioides humilatus]KAA1418755.1 glycoside hydrolase family 5 protein [Nocardioides humilatus]
MSRLRTCSIALVAGAVVLGLAPSARAERREVSQPVVSTVAAVDATSDAPQLRRKGRWMVDQYGRVVIVHGFNLVWKKAPYAPPETAAGFTAADAQWLKDHGFNGVRLGTMWAGITPDQAGIGDETYRDRWQRVMDLLADQGIWMQLDAHQDQWHETYGGEGVPDWAMIRPAPFNLLPPVNLPFPLGYWTPEVSTVFDRFWANKDGLLDGWVDAWKVAAGWWQDQPYLMGYDLMNEPWMGLEWSNCLKAGCHASYTKELQPAFEKATTAIRALDSQNIVWWEPQQLAAGQKAPTYLEPMAGERRLGLSWHNYCQDVFLESQGIPGGKVENCWKFSRDREQNAVAQARKIRAVPMMSEWGATDNVRAVEIDAAVADEHLMSWLHWAYKRWEDPTTADDAQGMFTDDADLTSVKTEKLLKLVRTYAQAVAGTPTKMSFDAVTGDFLLRYRPDPTITQPTEVFVSPLHYANGYEVVVDGGTAVQQPGQMVEVAPTGTGPVTVRIADAG